MAALVAPSILIAANPYEGALCKKALADIGLTIEMVDSIEGAVRAVERERPVAVIVADGWYDGDARELLVEVRSRDAQLPIFLVEDRGSDIADEEAAIRRGATRLFLRPIEAEALGDAVEKLAVEAELAGEVGEQLDSQRGSIEMEAIADDEWASHPSQLVADTASVLPVEEAAWPVEEAAAQAEEGAAPVEELPSSLLVEDVSSTAPAPVAALRPTVEDALAAPAVEDALSAPPLEVALSSPPVEDLLSAPSVESAPSLSPVEAEPPSPLPRVRTEVMSGPQTPSPTEPPLGVPPPTASLPIARITAESPLLRADEALAEAAGLRMQSLATQPDFVVQVSDVPLPPAGKGATRKAEPRPSSPSERSTMARRLDRELSELERRLFPEAAPASRYTDDYEDALSDIDLDSLGIDTIPGIALETLAPAPPRPRNGNGNREPVPLPRDETSPLHQLAERPPRVTPTASAPSVDEPLVATPTPALDEEGDLADHDVAALMARLHASGFTGRVRFSRGEQDKRIYFDEGAPVFATSSLPNDRLGDLLWREGKLTREQMQKTRTLSVEPGRRTAAMLVELGLLKSNELFPALRRSVEEIVWSLFGWDDGRYALGPEQPPPDERVRPSGHTWGLILEGVRRKYSLERLIERVGPPETVLTPTTALDRALADAGLSKSERAAAALFDGERSISDVLLELGGAPGSALTEASLYALAWGLSAVGALRAGGETDLAVRAASTLVTGPAFERRSRARNGDGDHGPEPENDRTVDRERLLAKQAQIADCDYFSVLGVDRQASPHEIDRAWERLRGDFAPERFAPEMRTELDGAFSEIREVLDEAHRVLRDDGLRRSYREHLLD